VTASSVDPCALLTAGQALLAMSGSDYAVGVRKFSTTGVPLCEFEDLARGG
jgi:hypothetical protein